MNIKEFGTRAIKKTILAALMLGSAHAAYAVMTLNVSYDEVNDSTTILSSEAWDVFFNVSDAPQCSCKPSPTVRLSFQHSPI